ncbi:MAG TPA: DUF3208 family protein [Trueperaceae bacterium]|nr:DUF3208 family protein [Trueperaceae bacterium]
MTGGRDDRELWREPGDAPRPVKLLQGYVWHPVDAGLDLAASLAGEVAPDVHLLLDAMPRAPFAFFDDGTPSSTQVVYQLTLLAILAPDADPARVLVEVAPLVEERLETTPPSVGWQLMEDLREVG